MYGDPQLPKLVGLKVNALFVSEDDSSLVLQTDSDQVAITTDADCCSETWFADIVGVSNLIGHTITAAVDVEMPEGHDVPDDGRTRQEEDEFYGLRLTTEAGDVDIIYRNSSNGYYGGSIDDIGPGDPKVLAGWNLRPITTDWQAGAPVRDY